MIAYVSLSLYHFVSFYLSLSLCFFLSIYLSLSLFLSLSLAQLQQLVSLDITRVLTSGTYSSALAGAHVLNSLHALHLPINIMAGAGVSPSTLPELLQVCPWLTEVHASARSTRHSTMRYINPNTLSMGSSLSSTPQYHLESDLRFANRLIVSELVQLIETKEKQFIL